ncbi:Caspase domain-containing protein [Lutibacter agarilyticus]|uniref:Caspase domain-containing protein n=1 Tax=Lutibacter agarilyticus TaxID=1109740 RepID=A0A238XVF5_9FLAO|nr:caspase family protein [Lutibacter agarilyticus]SNR62985.1 Caspase domain-containing protein [Lutibacter agarilyticus]
MKRILLQLLFITFCQTIVLAQKVEFKTNFGNDGQDGRSGVLSSDNALMALNRSTSGNNSKITLWDLNNNVVLYSVDSNPQKVKGDNYPHFSSISFSPEGNYLGYICFYYSEQKEAWEATYFVYEIRMKKLIKEIPLEGVFYGSFIAENEVLLKDCNSYCSEINWFKLNINNTKKTLVNSLEASSWDGFEILGSISIDKVKYSLLLDDDQLSLFTPNDTLIQKIIATPKFFDPKETWATDINLTPNLKHAIFLGLRTLSVLDLKNNNFIADSIPLYNYSDEKTYGLNGLVSKDGEEFIFVSSIEENTGICNIKNYNMLSLEITDVASVKNTDYEMFKFISGSISEKYDFSKLKAEIEFKTSCRALLPENYLFEIYNEYFISVFNGLKVSIFNASTGRNKTLDLIEINELKQYEANLKWARINALELYDDKILLAYTYYVEGGSVVKLLEVDLNSGNIARSLDLADYKECSELKITKDNENLLLNLKPSEGLGFVDVLIDIESFKDITQQGLFESRYYHTIYATNNNQFIVGYIKGQGSYVYNKDDFKFIEFFPDNLIFYEKDKKYSLHLKYTEEVYEYEDFCENCKEGVKQVIKTPTNEFELESAKGVKSVNLGEITASLFDEIDENLINIKQKGKIVAIESRGNLLLKLNLKTGKVSDSLNEYPYFPKINANHKDYYLVGIEEDSQPIEDDMNNEIEQLELGYNIAYTDNLNEESYKLTKFEGLDIIYDLGYINNKTQVVLSAPYNSMISVIKSPEDYEYLAPWVPEKYWNYPSIEMSFDINYYDAETRPFDSNETEFENVFTTVNYKYLEKEEEVLFESVTYEFINFKDQTKSSFVLEDAFEHLAKVPFIAVDDEIFVSDKSSNRTLRLNLKKEKDHLESRITPYTQLFDWKSKKGNEFFLSKNSDQRGVFDLISLKDSTLNAKVFFTKDNSYSIFFADNYYMGTKDLLKYSYFQKGDIIYKPEQFDFKYNRPDIVLKRLGYGSKIIGALNNMYHKRLKKSGVNEEQFTDNMDLPIVNVPNKFELPSITNDKSIVLKLNSISKKSEIVKLNVWINDVPVNYEVLSKNDAGLIDEIQVELAINSNKIQLSVLNENGFESLKETIEVECTAGKVEPDLYLVSIGVSEYFDENYNLKYASKDAKDILNQFSESKQYENVYSKLIIDENVTKSEISNISKFLNKADIDDAVIVFVASHGVLDENYNYFLASHDINFNNPSKGGIPFDLLETQLDNIAPLKKMMFIDACHSGEVDVDEVELSTINDTEVLDNNVRGSKGNSLMSKSKNLDDITSLSKELFSDLRRGNGTTIISSAGGLEFAYEGKKWQNGLFTYCMLNGISTQKADLNNDGEIILSELQAYVGEQVLQLSNGKQQPTSRIENISVDYRIW